MAVAGAEGLAGATPSLERARELAGDFNLIPVSETFVDDTQTPVSAFLKLREPGGSFLLESAEQGRVGRYSFIGFRPRRVLRWSLGDGGDPYALAAAELAGVRAAPLPGVCRPAPRRRRSPGARSACSPTTWCEPSSRSPTPTPIRWGSRTWR